MLKKNLKNGMIVVVGGRYFIFQDGFLYSPDSNNVKIENYDENLEHKSNPSLNVVKVLEFDNKSNKWQEVKINTETYFVNGEAVMVEIFGNRTTVTVSDGTSAFTTCLPEDAYTKEKGIQIAYGKCKLKQIQKKLKELMK